ncbi:G-type lectin S-receptor-like serine/threonine-protein [Vigna angularis]|uniref:G-type lectin S-receptor-like serine/threonine-protein n=1 Tax=Phaseolus angularis TaxID=3914 RepID=A0A8T0LCL1_PHAAN|nr:G-type lectin S-receptor-like serine/threonine-protein [Vigna angularis]
MTNDPISIEPLSGKFQAAHPCILPNSTLLQPFSKTDLAGCQTSCRENCSCLAMSRVKEVLARVLGVVEVAISTPYQRRKQRVPESPSDGSEETNFLENLTSMPIRYSYKDLETATNKFSVKLGQGGFGSVYKGVLADGTQIVVKKLESIGQGKKEFRAEVYTNNNSKQN